MTDFDGKKYVAVYDQFEARVVREINHLKAETAFSFEQLVWD